MPKIKLPKIKIPRALIIVVCALPAVLTALFYALHSNTGAMAWAVANISAPIRGFLGRLSSIYPISIMEIACVAIIVWLVYYIVKTIIVTVQGYGKKKIAILSKRLLTISVVALYIWSLYCWLWNSGYFAPGFAAMNGFEGGGVAAEDLAFVAGLFADKANELAPLVKRDEDGRFIEDRSEFFAASTEIYVNIAAEYPSLDGRLNRPKSMMFSWLMSRTGYTGVYFALTGESNINTRAPGFLMPATIAHELAHQRGVFAEDEANFVAIAACTASGNTVYEYSGYLMGLMHLMGALSGADFESWLDISGGLCHEVNRDWQDNYDYWQSQKKVETGIEFIDNVLTGLTGALSDTVEKVYDGYLKSNNQTLGVRSYGACVDLLVEYFKV